MKRQNEGRVEKKTTELKDPVQELLRKNPHASSPEEVIEEIARDTIRQARIYGWNGPPFDPKFLASLKGITTEPKLMRANQDAMLKPDENGNLKIEYNISKPETRQNYSIAHEVVHTFFPDYEQRIQNRMHGKDLFNAKVEQLCDYAAALLLLPEPEFLNDMIIFGGVGLNAFDELRLTYRASREATANRMVRLSSVPCAVIYGQFCLKPVQAKQLKLAKQGLFPPDCVQDLGFDEKLRVRYSICSDSFKLFIPKHKSIDDASPIVDVAKRRSSFVGDTSLDFGRGSRKFYVEATSYPVDDDQSSEHGMISFIFPK